MSSSKNTNINPISVVRQSQKEFHIDRPFPSSGTLLSRWPGSAEAMGVLTLKICSVESSTFAFVRSGVTDDVKRPLDDINAAERGLANPIWFVDGWEDAEMLLSCEALESRPGYGDSPLLESRCSS